MNCEWLMFSSRPQYVQALQLDDSWFISNWTTQPRRYEDKEIGFVCNIFDATKHIEFSGNGTQSRVIVGGWVIRDATGNFSALAPEAFEKVWTHVPVIDAEIVETVEEISA